MALTFRISGACALSTLSLPASCWCALHLPVPLSLQWGWWEPLPGPQCSCPLQSWKPVGLCSRWPGLRHRLHCTAHNIYISDRSHSDLSLLWGSFEWSPLTLHMELGGLQLHPSAYEKCLHVLCIYLKVSASFRRGGRQEAKTLILILSLHNTWWVFFLCLVNKTSMGIKSLPQIWTTWGSSCTQVFVNHRAGCFRENWLWVVPPGWHLRHLGVSLGVVGFGGEGEE